MKRTSIYCAAAIAAALALGAMAGCSSQPASQASASAESASVAASASAAASEAAPESAAASEAAEKSQDEIIAELKESLSNVPAYKSVTVTEKILSWPNEGSAVAEESSSASAASSEAADVAAGDTEYTSVYKFDASGDKLKTSATVEMEGEEAQYYTDGDDAVYVTEGTAYSGTPEQFMLTTADGCDAYLKAIIGDLNSFIDCIISVTQDEIEGVMGYELVLDPEKCAEFDESLGIAAAAGGAAQEMFVTVGFDKDGRIPWMTRTCVFPQSTSSVMVDLTDYDSTVVDPMPEATKTFEDMEAAL